MVASLLELMPLLGNISKTTKLINPFLCSTLFNDFPPPTEQNSLIWHSCFLWTVRYSLLGQVFHHSHIVPIFSHADWLKSSFIGIAVSWCHTLKTVAPRSSFLFFLQNWIEVHYSIGRSKHFQSWSRIGQIENVKILPSQNISQLCGNAEVI